MEYLIIIIVAIIAGIIVGISQAKVVGNIEKDKLIPILNELDSNPYSKEKHQNFIASLSLIDEKKNKFKRDDYSYNPSEFLLEKLLGQVSQNPYDQLAHDRFMEVIQRSGQLSYDSLFRELVSQIIGTSNVASEERFSICVSKARFLPISLFEPFLQYLINDPLNSNTQQLFLYCMSQIMLLPESNRQRVYEVALKILEEFPTSSSAKQFVISVGRWHFGKSRQGGRVTIYDEQRIQNDILVRI